MNDKMTKKSIVQKTLQFGSLTLISRLLGMIRDLLQIRLLGFGAISDAFLVALRIPNTLRKVFAEGALSSAFVPSFVKIVKQDGKEDASRLISISMLFFQAILLLFTIFVVTCPRLIIGLLASGFSEEQISYAVPFVRVLFPFILFISASALLSAALQASNHFFMIAFAPIILNITFLLSIALCFLFKLPVIVYCIGIVIGGILQFLCYLLVYFRFDFSFQKYDANSMVNFKKAISKFGNCLFATSVIEISIWIDTGFASYFEKGSISIITYGYSFMRIPLGIFAIGFATVLLSHLTRTILYAPSRLSFYLLEATKFNFWISLPSSLFLIFVSEKIFSTLMLAGSATNAQILKASWILTIFACAIIFLSWNKVLTNVFYAFHDTWTPTLIGIISTILSFCFNMLSYFYFGKFAIYGIAFSTVLSGITTSILSFLYLHRKHNASLHIGRLGSFASKCLFQLSVGFSLFYIFYLAIFYFISKTSFYSFFYYRIGYWVIVSPLCGATLLFLFFTRKQFGLKIYFLDR
ncbi:TPA: murein biosynthesis integral membrane protein MurJ [Candidatus Dependentiae bacterium]|nr:MAG: Integral membrane protein MviN [candidate division TM6 bacterium GW2011_GWE2_31_21]KKP53490.1 MAG: Integral membrane protein MviN [candidate division TM6 bacterium GW2011_GWF2_33_332]HBS48269.1 murein biosynthesis integral membrane protein MurJ [Candidatus Dependentiae bacterium]HBZ73696.1 murein biosynthesis integral membrane protein MurJ [Candidatus Dependentiae bacterium]